MTTMGDTPNLHHGQDDTKTEMSHIIGDATGSTLVNLQNTGKNAHPNSLVSFLQDIPEHVSNPKQDVLKFSTSLLKNKALLVPTRLALRRQRPSVKASTVLSEPILSNTHQIELGNPEDLPSQNDHRNTTNSELNTLGPQVLHLSREKFRMQSTSNQSSPLREDTPHTLPTDISLLYRYVIKMYFTDYQLVCFCIIFFQLFFLNLTKCSFLIFT